MESAAGKRDEQERGDAISQSGSGRDNLQGNELAEHTADGEPSDIDGVISNTSAKKAAGHVEERDVANDAGNEAVVNNPNGISPGDQRDLRSGSHDLQSTLKLGDAVEDDARAVAKSLTALLASLKSALSEVTGSSLEHMRAENEAAGQVQDVAIDAATKGNRFINSCLRLNEEMKGMNGLATQLETLKQRVDQFEYLSMRYLPRQ